MLKNQRETRHCASNRGDNYDKPKVSHTRLQCRRVRVGFTPTRRPPFHTASRGMVGGRKQKTEQKNFQKIVFDFLIHSRSTGQGVLGAKRRSRADRLAGRRVHRKAAGRWQQDKKEKRKRRQKNQRQRAPNRTHTGSTGTKAKKQKQKRKKQEGHCCCCCIYIKNWSQSFYPVPPVSISR